MTTPGRWEEAKRLFDAALTIEASAREEYLRGACNGDAELLDEVRSLLAWHDEDESFLEAPAARVAEFSLMAASAADMLGRSLGAWRIIDVIGHGGMGVVYRAERADAAFQRSAAIKVVRPGADLAQIVERFRIERETLAALDHPNIARLLDGGTTDEGYPYFVMELVDGIPIDRYCDEQRLSIGARLKLFLQVCAGVQYAHENLVVHRDIKPDNILVAKDGTPKLLDFGVAKIVSQDPATPERITMAATWLMTPDYASPEQLDGRPSTTSTDVYSLGVLLHVLLTGVRPYHLTGTTPASIREQLHAAVLAAPRLRAYDGDTASERAAQRATTPGRLSSRLAGDLDAIVIRALGRTPSTRYSSVEQLVNDIERHRTSYPVAARRGERGYVARAFIKRHHVALGVAIGVLFIIIAGISAVLWQASLAAEARLRAERRFNEVRQLAGALMFDVHDAIVELPGATPARELIVKTTIRYLESLEHESHGDIGLQRELARAFVRVGDVQGNPTNPNLGNTAGALASYRRAIAIAQAALVDAPHDLDSARALAFAHRRLGDVLGLTGDVPGGVKETEESQRMYTEIASHPSPTLNDRMEVGIAFIKLGDILGNPNFQNAGRTADAERQYAQALAVFRVLDAELQPAKDFRARRFLGLTLERIGTMHETARRWPEAASAYQESFEIRRGLADLQPLHLNIQRDLGIAYEKLGNVRRTAGDRAGAVAAYRDALAQSERLERMDPSNANATYTVAIHQEKVATVELEMGRPNAALPLFRSALAIHRAAATKDPGNARAKCDEERLLQAIADATAGRKTLTPPPPCTP
jgi:eukaryotic-like serine/threonine-protein kinase